MVFKSYGSTLPDTRTPPLPDPIRRAVAQARPYQHGDLIALIEGGIERLQHVDPAIFRMNEAQQRVLLQLPKNDAEFDVYVGLPFVKGVTERVTGRTQLIVGSSAHHIEAMQNQFVGALWGEEKHFGDTVRWISIGAMSNGFIGLDYNPAAPIDAGVARNIGDVTFLSKVLLMHGYDEKKRLFLLTPPYIKESDYGRKFRSDGLRTLRDYARRK